MKSHPSVLTQGCSRPRTWSVALPMTRWCRPDQITQQSGAADVRILIENLYEFKVLGCKKLIWEFSDKGWNVKGFNKLLKKLQDSGSMTRRTGSGQRRCAFWCVASFYKVQYEHIKWGINWAVYMFYFKYPGVLVCFCQKLAKSDEMWQRYHKYKKGEIFLRYNVYCAVSCERIKDRGRYVVRTDGQDWLY